MTEITRRTCCHEIISFFCQETSHTPLFFIALDWKIICHDFQETGSKITWETTGVGQETIVDEPSVGFLLFSELGVHKVIYDVEKGNKIKSVLDPDELDGLKVKRLADGKVQFLPPKKHLFGNPVIFYDTNDWEYIDLQETLLKGAEKTRDHLGKPHPGTQPSRKAPPPPLASGPASAPVPAAAGHAHATPKHVEPQSRKEFRLFSFGNSEKKGDYYDEILATVKEDIKRIKNRKNKTITRDALKKMEEAVDIIRNCDSRIKVASRRIQGLETRREEVLKSSAEPPKERVKEIERKLDIEHRLMEKEKKLREQKLMQFHGLREAIETIRTSEERLSSEDVDILIDAAIRSEVQTRDLDKKQKKLEGYM